MAENDLDHDSIRLEMMRLLKEDQYKITETARRTGLGWFAAFADYPTEYDLIRHVLGLLSKAAVPLMVVRMGEPPGSRGIAYRIGDPDYRDLYIKARVEDDTFWLISFKRSDHA